MSKLSQTFFGLALLVGCFDSAKALSFSAILGKKEEKTDAATIVDAEMRPKLSVAEKKSLVEDLLQGPPETSIIDSEGIDSLELLNVASALGEPLTIFGQKVQKDLLSCPTKDQAILQKRSSVINALCEDKELTRDLKDAFRNIQAAEDDFLSFFIEQDEVVEKTLNHIYFGEKLSRLNKSAAALEGLRLSKYVWHSFSLMPITVYTHVSGLISRYCFCLLYNKLAQDPSLDPVQSMQCKEAAEKMAILLKEYGFEQVPSNSQFLLSFPMSVLNKTYSDFFDAHNPMKTGSETPRTFGDELLKYREGDKTIAIAWIVRGVIDAYCINRLRNSKNALNFYEGIAGSIQQRTHSVANIYGGLSRITTYCKSTPEICENFDSLDTLIQFCERAHELSNELSSLTDLLSTESLTSDPSFFSIRGRALAAYKLIEQTKELWMPALQAAGELEAYLGVAQKLHNGDLCFAQAVESKQPYIEAHNFKNPLVKNDEGQTLLLGHGTDTRDILVTGPHGCGKSVAQKGLAYSILTAMTFGVGFADAFIYSPFDKIFVYCNVKENVDAGLSSFMAECARIDAIEQEIQNLEHGEIALVLPDEAFKGTMEEEGAKRYYAFCRAIGAFDNTLLFGITHFDKLTNLEKDTNGRIVNYHVELLEPEHGEFIRTFKLIRGKPDWWFNDSEKRDRYITWLKKEI